jgi:hypothetical protein
MEHVEVRHVSEGHGRSVKEISGFEKWRVEGASVEAHEQVGARHALRNRCEQRTLCAVTGQKVLPRAERPIDELRASHEKRVRSRSTRKTRCFKVEKERRRTPRAAIHAVTAKDASMGAMPLGDIGAVADSPLPVVRLRGIPAIDDDAGASFELTDFPTKHRRDALQ